MCGALRPADSGKKAVLMGWVNRRRDLGNLIFIAVVGTAKQRVPDTVNKNIATGEVEVIAEELRILNEAKQPPFLPSETVLPNEEMRLKYRYIDLRRDAMQYNIELRHKVALAIRDYLAAQGFFEIETPFMTRSTPEGARDYLVPSRVQPGTFYALPQSPQLFKQILMISGFDRYFQIVRCFRDEDLRADRQPEFTQIDLEMSYPQPERVWEVVEGFLTAAFKAAGHEVKTPFPRMSYDQAMRLYGSDKPDMRLPAMVDVRGAFTPEELEKFAAAFKVGPDVAPVLIRIPKAGEMSGTERRTIGTYGVFAHAQGTASVSLMTDPNRFARDYPNSLERLLKAAEVEPGDLWLLVVRKADSKQSVNQFFQTCGQLRLDLAQKYAAKHGAFAKTGDPAKDFRFLWVTDFPMFEWDQESGRWNAAHHPFTSLHDEDMAKLETSFDSTSDPKSALGEIRALAYDVVLNGTELGSGSIRIHRKDIQSKIFRALGMTEEEARSRFEFFLEALEYGTPPHGGIALGLDRIVMILAGADSLREVIPFPKTARAVDLMVNAPSSVEMPQEDQLELMAAWPLLGEREWRLATDCDELLAAISQETMKMPTPADTKYRFALWLILAKAFNDARSAVRLCKSGYGVQASMIVPSIIEGALNSKFILLDPTISADSFLDTILEDNKADIAEAIAAGVDLPADLIQQFSGVADSRPWPDLQGRLAAVGTPEKYRSALRAFSEYRRYSIRTIATYLSETSDGWAVRIGRGNDGVETALFATFDFMSEIAASASRGADIAFPATAAVRRRFFVRELGAAPGPDD